jgi:hypothetical protein
MPLAQQIAHLSSWEFWGLTLLAAATALVGLYLLVHYLRLARTIEDTPTARVRSAHQGYVELAGTAMTMPGEPILGPLTGLECCWYSYKVERRGDRHWRTIEKGSSDHLFLLRDDTGDCIMDPEGATVTPAHTDSWYGHTRRPAFFAGSAGPGFGVMWGLAGLLGSQRPAGSSYRYTESRIINRDPLYAIGLFRSLDEINRMRQRDEITRDLLHDWKQDRAGLKLRFDRNRDGQIDATEWEQARTEAARQARTEQQQLLGDNLLHTMSDSGDRHTPYLISTLEQFDLVRRYRRFVYLSTVAFFSGGALCVWLLSLKVSA